MEMSGQPHSSAALLLQKIPQYLLDIRLGGPLGWSERGDEEKIIAPKIWIQET
jgi:hypothetical protein